MLIIIESKKCIIILLLLFIVFLLGTGSGYYYSIIEKNKSKPVINQEINQKLQIAVQKIIDIRNEAVLKNKKELVEQLYNTEIRNGIWAYEHETQRINYLHNWAQKQDIKFNEINSEVKIRSSQEKENGFLVNLLIATEYNYQYKGSSKTNTFRLGTYHSLKLTSHKGKLLISREWYKDPFSSSLNYKEKLNQNIHNIISSSKPKDYNQLNSSRKAAIEYADKYCGAASLPEYEYQYNSDYKNYNYLGGDCANFASQIIHEGGGLAKTGIWNYRGSKGSKAWVNAQSFHNYMINSGRGSIIARGNYKNILKDSYRLLPGDYIAYEKSGSVVHISVVTGQDSRGYVLVNSHNTDRYRVPWDLGWNNYNIKFNLVRVNY
ncbi:MAG: amidase domain-containing protein [Bacillota bacterium]